MGPRYAGRRLDALRARGAKPLSKMFPKAQQVIVWDMDFVSKEKRSAIMRGSRSKDTKPEIAVRSFLHSQGFRFRLHKKGMPGKPDIVLSKYKAVIFVHGCFWHQHPGCKEARVPESNRDFWVKKFDRNTQRDNENKKAIAALGYTPITIWECETKKLEKLERLAAKLKSML